MEINGKGMAFESFTVEDIATRAATIHTLRRGAGPPLLLLHGYPQTHFIWHRIADRLSEQYTVVLTDLRGYGDSSKPEGGARHENYSFRAMAQDQVEVMHIWAMKRFSSHPMIAAHGQLIGCASTIPRLSAKFVSWRSCLHCGCIAIPQRSLLPSICGGSF